MRNLSKSMSKWPGIWLLFILLGAGAYFALYFTLPQYAWIPVAVVAGGMLLFVLFWHLLVRRKIQQTIIEMGLYLDDELSDRLNALDLPYAIVNRKGRILWRNEAFVDMVARYGNAEQKKTNAIRDIFPQVNYWEEKNLIKTDQEAQYVPLGDRIFEMHVRQTLGKTHLAAFLLTDETEHLKTLETLEKERGVAGLLYVDNFEELLKHTEADEHSLLGALIEQKIQKYFQLAGGVVCKTERDRFYIFMNAESLGKCKSNRFSLLNEVKDIKAGNSMLVTVSTAFGQGGATYQENLELAQAAMDLALSRGGDQAVVKLPDSVEYYGGKAQGEAAQTRVRARVKAQALRELMALHNRIYIMGHASGDNDSFGAAVGIYRAAASLHLQANIVLDTLSFSVRPLWERFQASAEYPRDMFLTSKEALERFEENAMVIVVDTNRISLAECPELLKKTDQIVVFDHHRQAEDAIPALLSYVEPYASSACEMITEILQYFGDGITPRPLEAEAMYSGILVDTNSFNDKTSSRTFEAAAFLKRSGADLIQVKKMLREDYREYKAKAEAMQTVEIRGDGFAFAECPAEGLDSPTIVGSQVANDLLNISQVRASFVFTDTDDRIYVSARAIDEVNVQLIMERLGGGGHHGAAGTQLRDISLSEAKDLVFGTIQKMIEEGSL